MTYSYSQIPASYSTLQHSNIADLLKPISNLAKVWDIDLYPYIYDFLYSFLPTETPDFRTAATLILGAAEVFGKKVDYLYEYLQSVLYYTTKAKRRRTTQISNFVLDLDVSTKDFDLSDFYSFEIKQAQNLLLKPRAPTTCLNYRYLCENDDYRISPLYNSILQYNCIVFEQWDDENLQNALLGNEAQAQPIMFSSPVLQQDIDEMTRTVELMRSGVSVQYGRFRAQDATPQQVQLEDEPLDMNALANELPQEDEPLSQPNTVTIYQKISDFYAALQQFTRQLKQKPLIYRKFSRIALYQKKQAIKKQYLGNYVLSEQPDDDLLVEKLDFAFLYNQCLTAYADTYTFYQEKAHTACVRKVVAADFEMGQDEAETVYNYPLELNFDIYQQVIYPAEQEHRAYKFETLRSQLTTKQKTYHKLETYQFLKWKNFQFENRQLDIKEVYGKIREKIREGRSEIRQIGGKGADLARIFMGSLLMASNGDIKLEIQNGNILLQDIEK